MLTLRWPLQSVSPLTHPAELQPGLPSEECVLQGSKGRHVSYQVPEAEEGPAARAALAQDWTGHHQVSSHYHRGAKHLTDWTVTAGVSGACRALLLPRVPLESHPGGARHADLRPGGPRPALHRLGPRLCLNSKSTSLPDASAAILQN